MKKFLLISLIASLILSVNFLFAETIIVKIPIVKNGQPITDTLDNGQVITFQTSSDDAEQENDEMDALYDDDLDAGWEGDPEDQNILTAGLRFQNVNIPKGATIEMAYLEVTSHEEKLETDVAEVTIVGEASDNAATYDFNSLITDRPQTNAKVAWTVTEPWGLWTRHNTIDFSSVIQEIVNRDGWNSGNALAIMLLGKNQGPSEDENAREFEAFENISDPEDGGDGQNHPERVPMLVVHYSAAGGTVSLPIAQNGAPLTDTLDNGQVITFQTSSDDAEQENDEMDALYDDDLDAGWEGDPEDQNVLTTGLRFQNIPIPQGAKITSAYLEVTSHEEKLETDVAEITIVGEASDNAATYDFNSLITDRPQTNAKVEWTVTEPWGLWTRHNSIDFAPVIEEIVNRAGWKAGNSLAIMLLGKNQGPSEDENAREFEAFENISDPEDGGDGQNHPERVPVLHITWNLGTSVNETIVKNNALNVFPNPIENSFTFSLDDAANFELNIYNQVGQAVKFINNLVGTSHTINVSELSSGAYILEIKQNNVIYTEKIIIK